MYFNKKEADNLQKDSQSEAHLHTQSSQPPHGYYKKSVRKILSQTGSEKEITIAKATVIKNYL